VGKTLFDDLRRVAEILDGNNHNQHYRQACDSLVASFDDPSLTYSARILSAMQEHGVGGLGLILAKDYRRMLCDEPFEILTEEALAQEQARSWQAQRDLEAADTVSFEEYLAKQNE